MKTKLSNDMKTYLECMKEAAELLEKQYTFEYIKLISTDETEILLNKAADIYASQSNSHKHGVMQAEVSDGAKEATVTSSAVGSQTSARTCATGCDWPNCTLEGCVDPKCDKIDMTDFEMIELGRKEQEAKQLVLANVINWVAVSERLPELNIETEYGKTTKGILCLHTKGHMESCNLNEGIDEGDEPYWSYEQDGDLCETVTHWADH